MNEKYLLNLLKSVSATDLHFRFYCSKILGDYTRKSTKNYNS